MSWLFLYPFAGLGSARQTLASALRAVFGENISWVELWKPNPGS